MTTTAPTPQLMTAVGHAILRGIIAGQGDELRSAADAIERLERMLPNASAECRLTAVLLAVSDGDPAAQPRVPMRPHQRQRQHQHAKSRTGTTGQTDRRANPRHQRQQWMQEAGCFLPGKSTESPLFHKLKRVKRWG